MSISKWTTYIPAKILFFYQEADKLVRCQNVIARYTKALAAQDVPTENSS